MSKNNTGKTHVYTGEGKGKTTAALGLAIRAMGWNWKVGIIYFDKGGDYYGERKVLDSLKKQYHLYYQAFGRPRMSKDKGFRFDNTAEDLKEAAKALKLAKKWLQQDFDLLILDEINTTVKTGLLKKEGIIALVKNKPSNLELVMTGRYCPPEIIALADLVTEMKAIKHYIEHGQTARKGIEY